MFNGFLRNFRREWKGTLILAGGLNINQADTLIKDNMIDLAAFGSPFIANPDFVERIKNGWPLSQANKNAYYGGGSSGYTDYLPYRE